MKQLQYKKEQQQIPIMIAITIVTNNNGPSRVLAIEQPIDRFHVTSSLSKIKNLRSTKGFIPIRLRRRHIYICLILYSSIAFFVWKPEHFEFLDYASAWHKTTIEFVEKKIYLSHDVSPFRSLSIRKSAYVNTYFFSADN